MNIRTDIAYDQIAGLADQGKVWVNTAIMGTANATAGQLINVIEDQAITYEAGTYFSRFENELANTTWQAMYAVELTAIPFYIVEGEPVFDTSIALTTSAKEVAFNTMISENTIAVDSEERTLSDKAFEGITGMKLKEWYDGEDIYLSQYTVHNTSTRTTDAYFYTDFFGGGSSYNNNNALRYWNPARQYVDTTNGLLGQGSFFAGTSLTSTPTKASTGLTRFDYGSITKYGADVNAIRELEPGKTYRFYYYIADGCENLATNTYDSPSGGGVLEKTALYYFDYTVATNVFGSWNWGGTNSADKKHAGTPLVYGYKKLSTSTQVTANASSYFSLFQSASSLYLPYSAENELGLVSSYQKAEGEVPTGYNGYYVLGGDIVMPNDGVSGSDTITNSKFSTATSYNTTVAANSSSTYASSRSIGALKEAVTYTDYFNASLHLSDGFTGTFDGRGYTIDASFTRGGIFGVINGGTVKNLNIKADFYTYSTTGFTNESYMEKAAVLAEVIMGGSLIENVSIELEENAPTTFEFKQKKSSGTYETPEMNKVPGIAAAQTIENSTLRNVIVICDSLKDVGNSIQNYRAALNLGSGNTLENVFVIGSSYSNMYISQENVVTLSVDNVPSGLEFNTNYVVSEQQTALGDYYTMIVDMYKWLRGATVDGVQVKFVREPATMHLETEAEFQAYILSEEATEAREAFTKTGMWTVVGEGADAQLVWAKDASATTRKSTNSTTTKAAFERPAVSTSFIEFFDYSAVDVSLGYNPFVVPVFVAAE